MKLVLAFDAFKGGLTAAEVCDAVAAGLREVDAGIEVVLKPMADGGEGTAAALLAARPDGQWIACRVAGPLPRRTVQAGYAWFRDDRTAMIEMAAANGLPLLAEHERNPMLTSSRGTGQLIQAAVRQGAQRILLAIGGSATVDGGVGAAAALGWRFLDHAGRSVPDGGGHLGEIIQIVPPAGRNLPPISVLCDVTNPLTGPSGAAAVFGPQKGATPSMVATLDAGLAHWAGLLKVWSGRDVALLAGAGAAGGLGAGAVALFNAQLVPGIAAIIAAARLEDALRGADGCLTGEGSFDRQSLQGKVVSGVAAAARAAGVPTAVLAGRVAVPRAEYRAAGVDVALAIHDPDMPLGEAVRREAELLRQAAAHWLREFGGPSAGAVRKVCFNERNDDEAGMATEN